MMYKIYENHWSRLPFVRIRKIELHNFKSVQHGIIEMNCSKEFIPYDTKSDILGLYGQNGSGKSSLVEALSLVKGIIGGYHIGSDFTRLIDVSAEYATIYVELDFQYKDGTCAIVSYEVKLESKENKENSTASDPWNEKDVEHKLCISDEIIKTNLYADGTVSRLHTIVDTKNNLFCGESLAKFYYENNDSKTLDELTYIKRKSYEDSLSFVFNSDLSELFSNHISDDNPSKYYEILAEIDLYISHYLFIIGTNTSGLVQLKAGIPIFLPRCDKPLIITDTSIVPASLFQYIEDSFERINIVLNMLIPNLQLRVSGVATTMENGKSGMLVNIASVRDGKEFPFNYESDGIVKIVSMLADYIFAYNQGSTTLVVDEFDSGVFEFLLGELLQIFESSGKGQFIFTSHNLRPLEVIDKKFIRFTTSDPNNRYYKLSNIGKTNNLRDLYLREIQLGDLDVEIYKRTKSFKIAKALKTAGKETTPDGE